MCRMKHRERKKEQELRDNERKKEKERAARE